MNEIKFILKDLSIMLGIVASIIFFIFYIYFPFITNHGETITVPNLVGMNLSEIDVVVNENNLRYEIIDSSFYNEEFDKNSVLEQIPLANIEVKKNRKIYLTINPSSIGDVILPEIIQLTKRNAVTILTALDLQIGEFIYENNIGKDMVLHVEIDGEMIKPGTIIPKKSKIDLILGNGKKE